MGCILSFFDFDKKSGKPPDQRGDGSSVPLLILSREAGVVDGQARRQTISSVEAARMEECIRLVGQILIGTDDSIKKINSEIEELKRSAVGLARLYSNREFTAAAKAELSRIKYKIHLKSSLVTNLMQKDSLLETAKTAATHCLMNYQINQQLKDSRISELIHAPDDKSTDAKMMFDALQSTMDKLLDEGDTADISKEHVADFSMSTAEMNESDIRTLVDGWANELGPSSTEEKKDIMPKPTPVSQNKTTETNEQPQRLTETARQVLQRADGALPGTMSQVQTPRLGEPGTMKRSQQGASMMRRKPNVTE